MSGAEAACALPLAKLASCCTFAVTREIEPRPAELVSRAGRGPATVKLDRDPTLGGGEKLSAAMKTVFKSVGGG